MNIKKVLKIEAEQLAKEDHVGAKQVADWIISLKMKNGHIHNVLPDNESTRDELVEDLLSCTNIAPSESSQDKDKPPPEKIRFHNRQAFGDILTMTCAVRDFKNKYPNTRIGVSTTAMHIWDHNPHIDHSFRDDRELLKIGPGFLTNKSNSVNLHMANAFRLDIENKT